jgi:acyl carrier protein
MDDVSTRLIKCFETVFPDMAESEITIATQDTVGAWDSVAAITLLNVIEDEFQITMDLDMAAELDSFQKIQNHLAASVNA